MFKKLDSRNCKKDSKGIQVASEPIAKISNDLNLSLSREQFEQLQNILNTKLTNQNQFPPEGQQPTSNTSLLAQKGTFLTALNGKSETIEPWVIDSGATDHITGCANFFCSYKPSPRNLKIKIADGSFATIAGIGTVNISPFISLKDDFYVPKLSCNLLSVSKITRDLNCTVVFSHSHCIFQDMILGMRIGSAKEHNGLYYFEEEISSNQHALTSSSCSPSLSRKQQIMLWHSRLGHPSFPYLKQLFPSLFENKDIFQCDICQIAKHQRVVFSSLPYKSTKPFNLIHRDIWGPSRVPSLTGKWWFTTFIDDHTRITWVYLLKEKSEAAKTFRHFQLMVNNMYNEKNSNYPYQ